MRRATKPLTCAREKSSAAGMWIKSHQRGRTSKGAKRQANQTIQKKAITVSQLEPSQISGSTRLTCGQSWVSDMTLRVLITPTISAAMR